MPTLSLPFRLLPLCSLCLLAPPVLAQQSTSSDDAVTLDSVDVRANADKGYVGKRVGVGAFRDQSIMDVPATVNVVTRDLLDAQAAVSLYDVLRNTAGVTKQQLSGETLDNLAVRGIILDNRSNYRLNGSLPMLNQMQLPLEDKERVEVLKGVSALYYGYTSPGGVVNMVTKRADATPVTALGLSADDNGGLIGSLDVGRRFGAEQQFGVRTNLAGGGLQSAIDGIDGHRKMASAALDWRVGDRLNLKLDAEYFQRRINEQSVIALLPAQNDRITLPRLPDPSKRLSPSWSDFDAHGSNLLLHADYALGGGWVATVEAGRSQTTRAKRAFSQIAGYDLTTGLGTITGNRQNDARLENRNLRAEVFGTFDAFGVVHELTAGAAQTHSEQGTIVAEQFSGRQSIYDPVELGWLATTRINVTAALTAVDKGLYVTDRLSFGEHWQAIAGARYTDYKSDQGSNHFSARKTTPLGALIYKFGPQLSTYVSYASGIEQGDGAPNTAVNVNERLPPSISKQKEAGVRWQANASVLLSAAAFDIDRAASYVNSESVYVQSGREHSRGVELSAQGQLARDWMMQLSGQYLRARFEDISSDLEGKTPENTPKVTGSLFAQYTLPALPGLSFNGGMYYTGRRPVNDLNQAWLGGVTLFDLGARYVAPIHGRRVAWQVNVDNAANKRYWAATGNNRLAEGLPRTVKFSVKVDL